MAQLPPGFVLDDDQGVPAISAGLPEGFVLDDPRTATGPAFEGSIAGGLTRSAVQGATADFADNAVGLVGGDAERMREQDEAFGVEHPILHGLGKGAGVVGSTVGLALAPGGQLPAAARTGGYLWRGAEAALNTLKNVFGSKNAVAAIPGARIPAQGTISQMIGRVPGMRRIAPAMTQSHAAQGGIAALKYGMLDRAGQMDEVPQIGDGWDNMIGNATNRVGEAFDPQGMLLDYGIGRGGTWAGNKAMGAISRGVDEVRNAAAAARGQSGASGAEVDVSRQLQHDGVTPQGVRDQVFPAYRGMNQDEVMHVMQRYGELVESGVNGQQARATIAQGLAAQGLNARTARSRVNAVVSRYHDQNTIPAQLNELAAITSQGDASATHNLYRAGINMKGDSPAASRASDFVTARQPEIAARLDERLTQELGDGNVANMLNDYSVKRGASNDLYGPIIEDFDNTPAAADALQQALENVRLQMAMSLRNRTDDIAQGVRGQLDKFTNPETEFHRLGQPLPARTAQQGPTNTPAATEVGNRGMRDLDAFIHQRRALTDAIEDSKDKFGRDTAMTSDLRDLKRAIDDRVRGIASDPSVSPEAQGVFQRWAGANDQRRDLEALQRAYNDGASLQLMSKTGQGMVKLERTLARFEDMGADHSRMFMRGVMAQLKGQLETKGDLHNAATIFSNRRMRRMMEQFMSPADVNSFYQLVRRANLAKRTQSADKNSPTGAIRDEKERAMIMNRLHSAASSIASALTSPGRFVGEMVENASNRMFREQMNRTMELLGSNTDQPHLLIQSLRALDNSARYAAPNVADQHLRRSGPFIMMGVRPILTEEQQRQP